MARTASVVNKSCNRRDAGLAQGIQRRVYCRPVDGMSRLRIEALPDNGISHGLNAQGCNAINVLGDVPIVAAILQLIQVKILYPVERTFKATPDLRLVERLSRH